jgi:hypothetical protein
LIGIYESIWPHISGEICLLKVYPVVKDSIRASKITTAFIGEHIMMVELCIDLEFEFLVWVCPLQAFVYILVVLDKYG